ncbi:hypothetical protein [[Phormidium] sp. ETS-05]|uniref:hypothetical protein n=1 Tax=[Phormidium] sp. ETS-05 TaxID=222819 RepID=UPI0018EF2DD1|nr:hypothetical protein [[Phormidium] sp. ETS-05]
MTSDKGQVTSDKALIVGWALPGERNLFISSSSSRHCPPYRTTFVLCPLSFVKSHLSFVLCHLSFVFYLFIQVKKDKGQGTRDE